MLRVPLISFDLSRSCCPSSFGLLSSLAWVVLSLPSIQWKQSLEKCTRWKVELQNEQWKPGPIHLVILSSQSFCTSIQLITQPVNSTQCDSWRLNTTIIDPTTLDVSSCCVLKKLSHGYCIWHQCLCLKKL